jgi:hypothetical protein
MESRLDNKICSASKGIFQVLVIAAGRLDFLKLSINIRTNNGGLKWH